MNLSEQGAYNQICKEDCLNIDFLAAVARFNFYLSKLKITIAAVRLIQIYLCKLVSLRVIDLTYISIISLSQNLS